MSGTTLTGTAKSANGESQIMEGKVTGDDVTFVDATVGARVERRDCRAHPRRVRREDRRWVEQPASRGLGERRHLAERAEWEVE